MVNQNGLIIQTINRPKHGKYGNGHETRKRNIGCDDATYQLIRKRVNELYKKGS